MGVVELPFLYQTRTLLRPSSASSRVQIPRNSRRCQSTGPNEAPPIAPPESFLAQKARETAERTRRKTRSTLTRSEHQVFQGIFQHLSSRPEQVESLSPTLSANETDPDVLLKLFIHESGHQFGRPTPKSPSDAAFPESRGLNDHIRRYPPPLRNAARRALPSPAVSLPYHTFQPSPRQDQPASGSFTAKPISKDPRHGVYRPLEALNNLPPDDATTPTPSSIQLRNFDATKEDEIARGVFRGKTADYVEKELSSVSLELKACLAAKSNTGAFKIWDVCERRIFPIVKLLDKKIKGTNRAPSESHIVGVANPSLASTSTPAAVEKSKEKAASPQTRAISPTFKSYPPPIPPSSVSALATVTTLYPTLTLLALRLLTIHYPTTALPLHLHTTLQSTSPSSRILALNVHFYNTLLAHTWSVYSDLAGLCALLAEMRAAGVDADINTYDDIICAVERERWVDLHQQHDGNAVEGSRGKTWWLRPEHIRRYAELMEWKAVVAARLLEMGLGHLLAEREYAASSVTAAAVIAGGVSSGNGPQELELGDAETTAPPSVWL